MAKKQIGLHEEFRGMCVGGPLDTHFRANMKREFAFEHAVAPLSPIYDQPAGEAAIMRATKQCVYRYHEFFIDGRAQGLWAPMAWSANDIWVALINNYAGCERHA